MLAELGDICALVAFVCWLIVLIDAFKSAFWKGLVGFFFSLYLLYYAIVEYQSKNKWLIVGGMLLGGWLGKVLVWSVASTFAHLIFLRI